ncbi:MAG: hypothetical protein A2X11_12565 [Bacteroidetes bacterium GWE2_42_24]|nr:MAG: hypothetical protein A2X11_12565 [Bacteroidetes bacterium GWE2_42_24]OFY30610.1 MAG: hypothetical protein A2X09_03815 [Bacteroidetes bacterium GWF2_43_11]PKP25052.1 MAG: hypothetical protein CVU06_04415 [Bacteroidetes bacterium HGW-Bacteroidetes-22]
MSYIRILGIRVADRTKEAETVQKLLTTYGCSVRTRLGLHVQNDLTDSSEGLIILELTGDTTEMDKLENALASTIGVDVSHMEFE